MKKLLTILLLLPIMAIAQNRSYDHVTLRYNYLNKELISELKIETANPEQVNAVFHVCCLFRSDRAFKRETWFNIINELLPELAPVKKQIVVDYENYGLSQSERQSNYFTTFFDKVPSIYVDVFNSSRLSLSTLPVKIHLTELWKWEENFKEEYLPDPR